MDKETAIKLLGETVADAAAVIGTTRQAVHQWPDPLPPRIEDRVLAAQARRYLPPHLIGQKPRTTRKAR